MSDNGLDMQSIARILAKARTDETFRQRLLDQPAAAPAAEGVTLPAGMELRVLENSDSVVHLVLPQRTDAPLSDEALDAAVGGYRVETPCEGSWNGKPCPG